MPKHPSLPDKPDTQRIMTEARHDLDDPATNAQSKRPDTASATLGTDADWKKFAADILAELRESGFERWSHTMIKDGASGSATCVCGAERAADCAA